MWELKSMGKILNEYMKMNKLVVVQLPGHVRLCNPTGCSQAFPSLTIS